MLTVVDINRIMATQKFIAYPDIESDRRSQDETYSLNQEQQRPQNDISDTETSDWF